MKHAAAAFSFFLALFAAIGAAWAHDSRPVVVELFTSQGCSSCPLADALLGKLARRKDVLAMSLPITYWDMLGWKDTLACEDNTRRQKAYAAQMGRGGVYTPQIVVDGTADVVGSQTDAVEAAIAAAEARLRDHAGLGGALIDASAGEILPQRDGRQNKERGEELRDVPVDLNVTPRHVHIAIAAARAGGGNATIWLFRLRPSVTVAIRAGENAGRTVTYHNVVSDIRNLGRWTGKPVSLDVPQDFSHEGVAVVLQQGGYGRVIGAAYRMPADAYAEQ